MIGRYALVVVLVGCAPRDAGFGEVRQMVARRAGVPVRWERDDPPSSEVVAEVRTLLRRPLTADAAVRIALLHNRDLQGELEALGIARAALAGAGRPPNVHLEGQHRFADELHRAETEGSATIDVMAVLRLGQRRGPASAELEAEKVRVAGAALELALATRTAFIEHVASLQDVRLQSTALEAAAAGYEAAREMARAGNVTELDLSLQQAGYEEARLARAAAEALAAETRERLQVLMGLWGERTSWTVAPELPGPSGPAPALEHLEARAVERSLELLEARHRIEAAGRRLGLARSEGIVPRLEAGLAVEREEDGLHMGPTVALTLPLFDQGQGATGTAAAELRQLQARYVALAVRVRSAARAARTRLLAARERARFTAEVVLPLRARIVEQTLRQYGAMQVGVFQLLDARRGQTEAARQHVDSVRAYWIARAELEQVLAGKLVREPGAGATMGPASAGRAEGEH